MSDITKDSQSVQTYLTILQDVISRMASNSSSSKTWCITLVSAIVVIVGTENLQANSIWVTIIPVGLFLFLDCFYLGLERQYRKKYETFIEKLHLDQVKSEDLFDMSPPSSTIATMKSTGNALLSFSIWPFYGLLILMIVVLKTWIE